MAFSWKHYRDKAPKEMLRRYRAMALNNPDFAVNHPELKKELLNDSIVNKVETKKYIQKCCDKSAKYAAVPKPSVIIKRYNRVV